MIGWLSGTVLFSDGNEVILQTPSGLGYQVFCSFILPEGSQVGIYVSHVIKEAGQELFAFKSLRNKKLFELLLKVKGVGPKSAYALLSHISGEDLIQAILLENKSTLTQVSGVGPKAASQILLDLSQKSFKGSNV